MSSDFVHLHLHTDFSLLDGLGKIDNYMKRAREFGMGSVALTDHGALYGAINFYEAAHKAGVKPIIGCCTPGQLIYTESGVKPIEEVVVGERVLTHKGRYRPVVRTMTRHYSGTLYGVKASHSQTVWVTDEHPVLVLDRQAEGPHWVRADEVSAGRATRRGGLGAWQSFAAFPRLNTETPLDTICVCDYLDAAIYEEKDGCVWKAGRFNKYDHQIQYDFPTTLPVTEAFASFLGLFLAEGSFQYDRQGRPTSVIFSFGSQRDEAPIALVCGYLQQIGLPVTKREREERGSVELHCSSTVLARLLRALCGAGATHKRIPSIVYHFSHTNIRAFVDGLAAGDGKVDPVSGRVTLKMANRDIIYGTRLLIAALGWFGTVSEIPLLETSKTSTPSPTFMLTWSPSPTYHRHRSDDLYLFPPLREVMHRYYDGPVHNLEVDEDHSYVTDIILHNCEAYVAPRGMRAKSGKADAENYHLVLLAKNAKGYQNLIKLTSLAHTEGFYYKPRIDHEILREYSEGLIGLSACLGAEVPRALIAENYDEAKRLAELYRGIFGEGNYFLELQNHPTIPEQEVVNRGVIELSKELSLPLVCTADVHYLNQDDMAIQDVLICVQTGKTLDDPKRLKMTSNTNFFRPPSEMAELFAHVPEAVSNTGLVASMCELEIKTGSWILPHFPVPEEKTTEEHLRDQVLAGLRKRKREGLLGIGIDDVPPPWHAPGTEDLPQEYLDRVEYELGIIVQKGYPAYFLIVQDFANWSREQGIVITTRGSAAGSLVSYGLGIVAVDPLVYVLPFERFLNPFRPSPPDIDMDFEDSRREEVIEYVTRKYGEDKVAQIITFGTMEAKAAIRDVGRVMGMSYGDVDKISKLIPLGTGLDRALETVPELRKMEEHDPAISRLMSTARRLEGVTRNAGTHAAGVIITEQPVMTYAPVQKDTGGGEKLLIQYDMRNAETIGLMKMDFLGLANLSVLGRAVKILKEYRGLDIEPEKLPLTDPKAYALLASGETTGLFQVESGGMRKYLKDLKPSTILDIAAMIALYRPGPMPFIPLYIERKHDRSKVKYLHPSLEPILKDSFGVLVYQDDILFISIQIAGYDWEKADKLRKAVGKKDLEVLKAEEEKFVKGCQSHGGLTKADAQEIWEWMLPFARYGFNKCAHAQTRVLLPDGQQMTLAAAYRAQPSAIMAMWPDGEIRPHNVQRIVKTGRKELLKISTASRVIKVTPEHRLLTTDGYKRADELQPGMELMTAPRSVTENMRRARRETMTRLNRTPAQRQRASERMIRWQATRTPEEKVAHMRRVHAQYPRLTRNAVAAMHERVKWLWANDPAWRQRQMTVSFASVRAAYDTGPGYGHCSIASNGMWCASRPERDMCEWLIEQGVAFEMHKVLTSGRICDFYFAGVYWEMDGMDRSPEYFAAKYGDLPHVVVTPEDFKFVVEAHLALTHAQNGDPIVAIEVCAAAQTYDVEMAPDGPLNFIANGIVSHNSHAAAYAQITYQTAYLKANYPAEYMAAFLSTAMGDSDKVVKGVVEVRRMGEHGVPITILPPSLNRSQRDFSIETVAADEEHAEERQGVRFGLAAVKNVGVGAINAIIAARADQPDGRYASLEALCTAVDSKLINKRVVESLIKAGALDDLGGRGQLLDQVDAALTVGQRAQRARDAGQISLFGMLDAPVAAPVVTVQPSGQPVEEIPRKTLLAWEKEVTGLYFSEHPLSLVEIGEGVTALGDLTPEMEGRKVTVVAMVNAVRRVITKKNTTMGIVALEDMSGAVELVAFPDCFEKHSSYFVEDELVKIVAKVEQRHDAVQLVCESAETFVQLERPGAERHPTLHVNLTPIGEQWRDIEFLNTLRETLRTFDGDEPVILHVASPTGERLFRPDGLRVNYCADLEQGLIALLGPSAFRQEFPKPVEDIYEALSAD